MALRTVRGAKLVGRAADDVDEARVGAMHAGQRNGLDYTPLFRFLLSRVGRNWDEVYAEAVARLDRPEPIFWLVAQRVEDRTRAVRLGENSYFSGLFVDDDNRLAVVDPSLSVNDMEPGCACCTHTLNGLRFTKAFVAR